jgi:tRNA threonylcarbamoyladenosine biosynthesis protein TsaE
LTSSYQTKEVASWKKFYENDLQPVVLDFIQKLETPSLVILEGDLGAGKTTFTKHFAQNFLASSNDMLGIEEITSPTYSLINEFGSLAHADLYRIEDPEELVHLEIELYLEEKEIFLVEWGEKYLDFLSAHIPGDWSVYLARFTINPPKEGVDKPSRNLTLETVSH